MTAELPVADADFTHAMAALGPFEQRPRLAAAISGGADSMALIILANAWARARGGDVVALTVDHGLRPAATDEAARVAAWMLGQGIAHETLHWSGEKPRTGIQQAAREARYRLLEDWCRRAGVLHLLLGHQRQDQAETLLLRAAAGSGLDGLAGMTPLRETAAVRILRPLLDASPTALRATLRGRGQSWIDDPSNDDPTFARVRVRRDLAELDTGIDGLVSTARSLGRARVALEATAAGLIADVVRLHLAGYATVDRDRLMAAPEDIALRALGTVVTAVGGRQHRPPLDKLERLFAGIADGRAMTLARARVLAPAGGCLTIVREARGLPEAINLEPGAEVLWDGRFRVVLDARADIDARLAPLGDAVPPGGSRLPSAVRRTLPAFWAGNRPISAAPGASMHFRPAIALSGAGFYVA